MLTRDQLPKTMKQLAWGFFAVFWIFLYMLFSSYVYHVANNTPGLEMFLIPGFSTPVWVALVLVVVGIIVGVFTVPYVVGPWMEKIGFGAYAEIERYPYIVRTLVALWYLWKKHRIALLYPFIALLVFTVIELIYLAIRGFTAASALESIKFGSWVIFGLFLGHSITLFLWYMRFPKTVS